MKIKFIKDREEKAVNGRYFKKDEVYEVSEASGQHWINRQCAVQVPDSTRATKEYETPNEAQAAQLKANAATHATPDVKDDDGAKKLVK